MASGDQYKFSTRQPMKVAPRELTPIELRGPEPTSPHLRLDGSAVKFVSEGWYEVLLRVDWDSRDTAGTRFSHTKIPGQEPLHSEAIDAAVLAQISDGRQLLRGNSLFGPDRASCLVLEVWHDADDAVTVAYAELVVRELTVPWTR